MYLSDQNKLQRARLLSVLPIAYNDVSCLFLRVEPGNKAPACFSVTPSQITAIVSSVSCLVQAGLCCQGFLTGLAVMNTDRKILAPFSPWWIWTIIYLTKQNILQLLPFVPATCDPSSDCADRQAKLNVFPFLIQQWCLRLQMLTLLMFVCTDLATTLLYLHEGAARHQTVGNFTAKFRFHHIWRRYRK